MARLTNNHTIWTSPPPTSGAVTAAIVSIASQFDPRPEDADLTTTYQHLVEAMKFGFAKRTMIGDWSDESIRESVKQVGIGN